MSFRVKLRIKQWKVKIPLPNPVVRVDSGVPVTDLMLRYYYPRKCETGFQKYEPPPGVTTMLWNGIDPINLSAVQ